MARNSQVGCSVSLELPGRAVCLEQPLAVLCLLLFRGLEEHTFSSVTHLFCGAATEGVSTSPVRTPCRGPA